MTSELTEFAALAQQHGVHAAPAGLSRRTPHRYTGLFRFEGQVLPNEALVDGNQPLVRQGDDTPLGATFCALAGRQQAPLEILDAATNPQFRGLVATPVVRARVLIRDAQGQPHGTLCHYDMQRSLPGADDRPAPARSGGRAALPAASPQW